MPGPQNSSLRWSQRIRELLASEVDGASLALFRICFGVVMFAHAVKYLYPQNGTSLKGYLYDSVSFNFTYPGFEWVQPLPEPGWTCVFVLMGAAALGVTLGIVYRFAATLLFLSYSYIFLSEASKYNNHYYLMCLLAFLLMLTPADQRFSFGRWWNIRKQNPRQKTTVPFWAIFILRAQLFLVYFFGGIAKINSDWLTGVPMIGKGREVLAFWTPLMSLPEIEPIYVGLFIAWFGLVFDLSIGFLLIARRTRLFAFALTAAFHIGNHFLFPIGLFPIMALSTTLIFCEPDWPIRFWKWLRQPTFLRPHRVWALGGIALLPPFGVLLGWSDRRSGVSAKSRGLISIGLTTGLACFLLVQVSVPFRHLLIEGDANWTEEGQDFSWRMMLRAKDASHVIYHLVDDRMLVQDINGNARIDWSHAPQGSDKYLFVPIDSERFNWSHHPGLTMTFEPALGLRAIYPLSPGEDANALSSKLQAQWKALTNRDVAVHESLSWVDVLEELKNRVSNPSEDVEASIARIRQLLAGAEIASGFVREQNLADLSEEVEFLLSLNDADGLQQVLRRLQPFSLQVSHSAESSFLIVVDEEFANCGSIPEALASGSELLVWIDIGRLRPADWRRLPDWFATFEGREIKIMWNYANELNAIQKRRFSTSPWMIRQYSISIADRWQTLTSRRPEVYVTSNIMLNYRLPQPLIDPTVDLGRSSYSLSEHNEWILPLTQDVGTAVRVASEEIRAGRDEPNRWR